MPPLASLDIPIVCCSGFTMRHTNRLSSLVLLFYYYYSRHILFVIILTIIAKSYGNDNWYLSRITTAFLSEPSKPVSWAKY